MICFNELGNLGRLGNQLWQVMATIGIAERQNKVPVIPEWSYAKYFNLPKNLQTGRLDAERYHEPTFHYSEVPKFSIVDLFGYFQTDKYFPENYQLTFNEDNLKASPKLFRCVSVHIRRGDYLKKPQYHTNLDLNYYYRAMDMFEGKYFLVFSDDIQWCKDNLTYPNVTFMEGNTDVQDLYYMSQCDGHILANSSFSWWGKYLSYEPEKLVVIPKKWFGEKIQHDTKDLFPQNWNKVFI